MTIIDQLVVTLGLDSKDLEKKVPGVTKALKEIEGEQKKTEEANKKASKSFGEVAKAMTGFLAALGGTIAIKAFVLDIIDSTAALDRLSKNLGINVSSLAAWSNATQRLGGSSQGLQGTLTMLSKAQTELLLTGQSSLIPYFSSLGISLTTIEGKAKPVTDILLDLNRVLNNRMANGLSRPNANNMLAMMGIDQGTANLILLNKTELELYLKRQKEYGDQLKKFAPDAQKLQTSLVDLKQKFTLLGLSLLQQAVPALEKVLEFFNRMGDWVKNNSEFIVDFLKVMAVGLTALGVAALPIDIVVVAVLALAAAIALLWQDYQTWKRGGDSFIDWGKWEPGIKSAIHDIGVLRDLVKDTWGWLIKLHDAVPDSWAQKLKDLGDESKAKYIRQTGGPPGATAKTGENVQSLSIRAKLMADRVSAQTGVPAPLIYAAWAHETGNFTNRGSRELNNLAGINVPGGKGQDYQKFDSLQAFADRYAQILNLQRYSGVKQATTADQFAAALKAGGYYSDSETNYAAGINKFLPSYSAAAPTLPIGHINQSLFGSPGASQVLNGVPGASSVAASAPSSGGTASNIDKSVEVNTGDIKIITAATDAPGIAADFKQSLDYLFTSQANAGLY